MFAKSRELIRLLRRQHRLTQAAFADRIEASRVTVAQWEIGIRQPGPRARARIESEFGFRLTRTKPVQTSPPATARGQARIVRGDAWQLAETLAAGSVQAIVTSPPYFKLRTYTRKGEFGHGALGDYVAQLVRLFERLTPALRPDGAVWLNLGDTMRDGQLLLVPARVAIALQDAGWLLRSEVIFEQVNLAPAGNANRPQRSHEHVYLLSRSTRHYWDAGYMREPSTFAGYRLQRRYDYPEKMGAQQIRRFRKPVDRIVAPTRAVRSVWSGGTGWNGQAAGHPAVMPRLLAERAVLSVTRPGDLVLDPFAGSGTTGVLAVEHGRDFLGFELSSSYVAEARRRVA
jgi:DNA modification methylase